MARCLSANDIKRHRAPEHDSLPRQGTELRGVYDQLMASRGSVVPVGDLTARRNNLSGMYNLLQDYYGLDIRRLHGGWLLAGEWFGRVYVDYVAERA